MSITHRVPLPGRGQTIRQSRHRAEPPVELRRSQLTEYGDVGASNVGGSEWCYYFVAIAPSGADYASLDVCKKTITIPVIGDGYLSLVEWGAYDLDIVSYSEHGIYRRNGQQSGRSQEHRSPYHQLRHGWRLNVR